MPRPGRLTSSHGDHWHSSPQPGRGEPEALEGIGPGDVPTVVDGALLSVPMGARLVAGPGYVPGGCMELVAVGGVEKEKVVWGAGLVVPQPWTVLSMVPLVPQRAEMQPPVPSVVW